MEEIKIIIKEEEVLEKYSKEAKLNIAEIQQEIDEWMKTMEKRAKQRKFLSFLSEKFKEIEKEEKIVKAVYISAKVFSILRTLGKDFFEESDSKDDIYNGIYGKLWTANVIVKPDLNENIIFSSNEYIKDN